MEMDMSQFGSLEQNNRNLRFMAYFIPWEKN